jgi:hypothetical protein
MTAKKRAADSDDGVEWMTSSGGGGNRPLPRVSVLQRGLVLSVYPDKATLETMREEKWITVTVGFKKNEAGETTELLLRKGGPIRIRYDYSHHKPHVSFSIKSRGTAVAKPDSPACQVSRRGEDFVFDITDQLTITTTTTEPV